MKNMYFTSKFIKTSIIALSSFLMIGISNSCKEREEDPNTTYNIQFNVQGNTGVSFKAIVTQIGKVQSTKFNVLGTNWNSVSQIVKSEESTVNLSATASGADTDSRLIVKILVNGEVKATDTAKGVGNLVANTKFDLK